MRPPASAWPAGWDCHVHVFDAQAPVVAGHYRPAHRPLADIEALAGSLGCGRLVLVQPSVYGTDNSVLLAALRVEPGRHRAVVVTHAGVGDAELDAWHAAGVRGVRFNLVSPVGNGAQDFAALAPRLRSRGWHAQWYARPAQLQMIAQLHATHGVRCVIDHLGGIPAGLDRDDPAWRALQQLADHDAWIKLSGWYRLQATAPYDALDAAIGRVHALFGRRMVWGSDWPHTGFDAAALVYADQWAPVARCLAADAARLCTEAAVALYT